MRIILLYIFLKSCFFLSAQDKAPELPRFAFRGNIASPNSLSSSKFRHSFSGITAVDASFTIRLFDKFYTGVGFSHVYFKNQDYFRNALGINRQLSTSFQTFGGYIKIGRDHFVTDRAFVTTALNCGYALGKYQGVFYQADSLIGKYPTQFTNFYLEPVLGIMFMVEDNFGFGLQVSFNYNFEVFDSNYPNFEYRGFQKTETKPSYKNLPNKWGIGSLNIGVGFYYGIKRK
jgi:hypothetical protein